jgi:hypothetical protein
MGSAGTRDTNGEQEVERYREAAYAALDQLDWAIRFLYRKLCPGLARCTTSTRLGALTRAARGAALETPGG